MQRSRIVIFGSARSDGDTRKRTELTLTGIEHTFVDLAHQNISLFDYEHKNSGDDFIPLMEKVIGYDDIILATPVYWYAPSAQMKIFIDRLSDLLMIRKDLGRKLAGKNLFIISSCSTDLPEARAVFEAPIRMTCDYLKINYGGCLYCLTGEDEKIQEKELINFRRRLLSGSLL